MRSRPPKPPKRANGLLKTNSRCYRAIHGSALIRGNFYAGWNPSAVPEKYDAEAYAARFAGEAIIAPGGELVQKTAAPTRGAAAFSCPRSSCSWRSTLQSQPWWPPASTHHESFMIHCLAASICPAGKCLISADMKCDVKCSATSPRWESVTTPILLMRL